MQSNTKIFQNGISAAYLRPFLPETVIYWVSFSHGLLKRSAWTWDLFLENCFRIVVNQGELTVVWFLCGIHFYRKTTLIAHILRVLCVANIHTKFHLDIFSNSEVIAILKWHVPSGLERHYATRVTNASNTQTALTFLLIEISSPNKNYVVVLYNIYLKMYQTGEPSLWHISNK